MPIDTEYSRFLGSSGDAQSGSSGIPFDSSTSFDNPSSCNSFVGLLVTSALGFPHLFPRLLIIFISPSVLFGRHSLLVAYYPH